MNPATRAQAIRTADAATRTQANAVGISPPSLARRALGYAANVANLLVDVIAGIEEIRTPCDRVIELDPAHMFRRAFTVLTCPDCGYSLLAHRTTRSVEIAARKGSGL